MYLPHSDYIYNLIIDRQRLPGYHVSVLLEAVSAMKTSGQVLGVLRFHMLMRIVLCFFFFYMLQKIVEIYCMYK